MVDGGAEVCGVRLEPCEHRFAEAVDLVVRDVLHHAVHRRDQGDDLLGARDRMILRLPQETHQPLPVGELRARRLVEVGGELHKDFDLAVLGEVEAQRACRLLHRLGLGVAAHTRDGEPHVDGGALPGKEEGTLQKDLSVRNGDDVGGDIGGDVARLCFDDGQRGHRTAAARIGKVRRPLQEAGVQIKDVAGIRLAPRGASQKQAERAVCDGVFGEIVVDDEHVLAALHEVFAHRAARIGGDVLQGGGFARRRGDDDALVERVLGAQRLHDARDRACLLPDRDVDADDVLVPLIQDGVDGDGGLSRLPVADDELALTPSDGEHTVDGDDARFQRTVDGLTVEDGGGGRLDGAVAALNDVAQPVDGIAQRVDDAP